MSAMVCQSCGENPATIHLTEIKSAEERVELNFCEACATAKGIANEVALPSMLADMVSAAAGRQVGENLGCPHCGLSFKEFRRKGRLGCPMDYEAFAEPLTAMLRKMHGGSTHHTGRLPRGRAEAATTRSERLLQLRRDLQEAVSSEQYEEAARLRDEIQVIEGGAAAPAAGGQASDRGPSRADPAHP